jgi:HEAT repeat protein
MLGYSPLPRTLDAALRDMDAKDPDVRRSAISDLVRVVHESAHIHPQAVARITAALGDPAAPVRSTAALALAELGATSAVTELCACLTDPHPYVREMAMTALGEIRDPRALPQIERASESEAPELRYQAVIAYTRMVTEPERIAAFLLPRLSDTEAKIRYIALRVAEEQSTPLRASILASLQNDTDASVRFACAIFRGKSGHEDARALVEGVVQTGTLAGALVPKEDEAEAVELMGVWERRSALRALERRAFGLRRLVGDTCAFHARIALARLGHARAAREILAGLESSVQSTRASSVVQAGRARMQGARARILALRNDVDPALVDEALAALREVPQHAKLASERTP